MLFRRHRLKTLVAASHIYAMAGLLLLGLALAGVAVVIFDTVAGPTAAWFAGAITLVAAVCFWVVVPLPGRGTEDTSY
jgi:peptidoglycan/LPS O-acetylase OafA/YrhL